ncbi:hypothetical protein MLD38_032309 [Melastoma candidum]|uniref:Uncharacterized protein n=1 Tax=Melastoma candidum TaxID=119954 RepID=A0ACB9M587_9MYRT|nr:hypothetical protein MLD38_032309 [Melastoma candidum]
MKRRVLPFAVVITVGLYLLLLLSMLSVNVDFFSWAKTAEAGGCTRKSETFTGYCSDSSLCDTKCKGEGRLRGACHWSFPGMACFCYTC